MKVYDQNLTGASVTGTGRANETERNGKGRGASTQTSGRGDRVELSTGLNALSRAMSCDQSSRAGRVRELTISYQAGSYRPDPAETSRAMVADLFGSAA